jgi:hypothetical protein
VSNWDSLNLQFGFSCGAFVAQHVQGSALDYGFILDADAKAFFTVFLRSVHDQRCDREGCRAWTDDSVARQFEIEASEFGRHGSA